VRLRYSDAAAGSSAEPYRLLVQKQAGIGADRVSVRVTSSDGRPLIAWQGAVDRDRVFNAGLGAAADRSPVPLLTATDGILAGLDRWTRG
jgi:hypothetical protein